MIPPMMHCQSKNCMVMAMDPRTGEVTIEVLEVVALITKTEMEGVIGTIEAGAVVETITKEINIKTKMIQKIKKKHAKMRGGLKMS